MQQKFLLKLLTSLLLLIAFQANAQHEDTLEEKIELSSKETAKEERKEYIQHHLLDSYDFNLFSVKKDDGTESHIGFPLPIILWDNGLQVFSSAKFHHGESVAPSGSQAPDKEWSLRQP